MKVSDNILYKYKFNLNSIDTFITKSAYAIFI